MIIAAVEFLGKQFPPETEAPQKIYSLPDSNLPLAPRKRASVKIIFVHRKPDPRLRTCQGHQDMVSRVGPDTEGRLCPDAAQLL